MVQKSSGISSIFLSSWSEEDSCQNRLVALVNMQILVPAPRIQELKHSENETFRGCPGISIFKSMQRSTVHSCRHRGAMEGLRLWNDEIACAFRCIPSRGAECDMIRRCHWMSPLSQKRDRGQLLSSPPRARWLSVPAGQASDDRTLWTVNPDHAARGVRGHSSSPQE